MPAFDFSFVDPLDRVGIQGELGTRYNRRLMLRCAALLAVFSTLLLGQRGVEPPDGVVRIMGTVAFEKVAVTEKGLEPEHRTELPAAEVPVELVRTSDGAVLGRVTTNDDGSFALQVPPAPRTMAYLRVLADTRWARVLDVEHEAVYAIYSPDEFILRPGPPRVVNLVATDENRGSGPFHILWAIQQVHASLPRSRTAAIPRITVRWDDAYRGNAQYRPATREIWLKGDRLTDSDEYDEALIFHEYAHVLTDALSPRCTVTGPHRLEDELDSRHAWAEGFATFLSASIRHNATYIDSGGRLNPVALKFSIEPNRRAHIAPGPWSEYTVAALLWDAASEGPGDIPDDHLGLGLPRLWKTLTGTFRAAEMPDLIGFLNALMPAQSTLPWPALLNHHGIRYDPHLDPRVANPKLLPLPAGTRLADRVDSTGPLDAPHRNAHHASAFYTFTTTAPRLQTITVTRDAPTEGADPLQVHLLTKRLAPIMTMSVPPRETTVRMRRVLNPGTYVVEVRSWTGACDAGTLTGCGQAAFTINRTDTSPTLEPRVKR